MARGYPCCLKTARCECPFLVWCFQVFAIPNFCSHPRYLVPATRAGKALPSAFYHPLVWSATTSSPPTPPFSPNEAYTPRGQAKPIQALPGRLSWEGSVQPAGVIGAVACPVAGTTEGHFVNGRVGACHFHSWDTGRPGRHARNQGKTSLKGWVQREVSIPKPGGFWSFC